MLPFLSKEVNYETKSGAFLCTCFTDLLCGGCFSDCQKNTPPGVFVSSRTSDSTVLESHSTCRNVVKE